MTKRLFFHGIEESTRVQSFPVGSIRSNEGFKTDKQEEDKVLLCLGTVFLYTGA